MPRYTVELIVFAYAASVSSGNEVFVPDEDELTLPYPSRAGDTPRVYGDAASLAVPEQPPAPQPVESEPPAFGEDPERPPARQWIELELLEEQKPRMQAVHARLARLDAYRPIMRAAWTQTTRPKDQAPAVHLQALGAAPPGLDGTVKLYAGRFVHLVLDLALDAGPGAPAVDDRSDARRRRGTSADGLFGGPVRYRLQEDRIMRPGEIRYFDHPKFGVVARVTAPGNDGDPQTVAGD